VTREPDVVDEQFEQLLTYLRDTRGADFTGYKRPSLTRLVDRRMAAVGVTSYADYLDRLEVEAGELPALLDALLINVTAVFRDPAAWQALGEQLVRDVLPSLDPDEPIRVWSAACASGEEAYSLAILLHGILGDEQYQRRVKIYATDIDEDALAVARTARFSTRALEPLTDRQRADYFVADGDAHRFRSDLRPSLIFGRHDLLQDAPISRVLVLTCRNVLMYFTPEAQTRVLERLSFAVADDGLLMLGRAEMLLTQSHLFTPVDRAHRIFRPRPSSPAGVLAALAVGGPRRMSVLRHTTEAAFAAAPGAQVVLDAAGVVVLLNEGAQRDLGLSLEDVGRPFSELPLARVPVDLLATAVSVQASRESVTLKDVCWTRGGAETWWDVCVAPLPAGGGVPGVHVVFEEVTERVALRSQLADAHDELTTAYEELQSSGEELETTNEELQSAVEELQTTNEELQSTNEELETMNEELQSTNEELQTVNDELRDRTLEIDRTNGFLHGILEGLDVAVAVLDLQYRVQLWNVAAERLSGLRAFESEGIPLLDLPLGLPEDQTRQALAAVVTQGAPRAEYTLEMRDRMGAKQVRRVAVNRMVDVRGQTSGAVVTLSDAEHRQSPQS
jgi:two-component system CheB/CheR fusion protein